MQRASSDEHDDITTRISASTSGGGVPTGSGQPTNASWRIASRPTASGIVAIASAPSKPRRPTGKFRPETK